MDEKENTDSILLDILKKRLVELDPIIAAKAALYGGKITFPLSLDKAAELYYDKGYRVKIVPRDERIV